MDFQPYLEKIIELAVTYAPKLLLAIITLIVGHIVIKTIIKSIRKLSEKRSFDLTLQKFLISLTKALLYVLLIVSVASMVGIETTSFIAVLGAAGLAIGLALQGSLSNFAGGVLILAFKPFKVADVIDAQGFLGIVDEIQIFNTIIKTFDNRVIIIPNGALANGPITNITREDTRRVDMEFGVGYTDDIDKVKQILTDLIKADERVLNEPAEPFIVMKELGESSVNFVVRAWCKASDYWDIYFGMMEKVKKTFDKEGVSIPFPQRDVHLYQHNK